MIVSLVAHFRRTGSCSRNIFELLRVRGGDSGEIKVYSTGFDLLVARPGNAVYSKFGQQTLV